MEKINVIKNKMDQVVGEIAKMELEFINSKYNKIVDFELYVVDGEYGIAQATDGDEFDKSVVLYSEDDVVLEFNLGQKNSEEEINVKELEKAWKNYIEIELLLKEKSKLKERILEIENILFENKGSSI